MSKTVELEITPATQFATAYEDGRPIATVQRRRTYETGPAWRAFDLQGREIGQARHEAGIRRIVEKIGEPETKLQAVVRLVSSSRHGPAAQMFMLDGLLKALPDLAELRRRGETNDVLISRVIRTAPAALPAIEEHAAFVADAGLAAVAEAMSGKPTLFSPQAWHGVAVEIRDALQDAAQ